jgi:sn-glycerol 3-phosphate transport system ATP-binding protein
MNFLPGVLSHGGTAVTLDLGHTIPLADGRRPGTDGRKLTIGIRPEHVATAEAGIALQVDLLEPLGSETVVIGRLPDGGLLSVKVPKQDSPGETMHIALPAAHLHVFDSETTLRLNPA